MYDEGLIDLDRQSPHESDLLAFVKESFGTSAASLAILNFNLRKKVNILDQDSI